MSTKHEFIEESRKQGSSEPAFVASMAAENGRGAFVVAYLIAPVAVVLTYAFAQLGITPEPS